jgi:hypothetical protein
MMARITDVPKVIEEIDGRFRNSEYETSTITESDSIANGVSAIADLSTIIFSLCAVVGGIAYIQVTPDLALAAVFAIVTVSLAAAVVPVIQAVNISPALAFRKVI